VGVIDSLSTDETYESIEADMPDHDRRLSHAHLPPRVPMNTMGRACGVRGQAKPSISTEL
jgi:hypothetical protein